MSDEKVREFIICNPSIGQNINGFRQVIRMCIEIEGAPELSNISGDSFKAIEKRAYDQLMKDARALVDALNWCSWKPNGEIESADHPARKAVADFDIKYPQLNEKGYGCE